ncbi:hypothetical protein HOV56_gp34 [Nitrosopumilus spindle-shaped virus]|uniref:Uncharacterized protein n=1 Tax=Nitrosopumilus spindle-shaped virus TaxID=2508184 RepID=A0A514K2W4_9VIRU|nr:hypothetical protein HOV56_gp34 [Nitrosopumilus spindle-shaped virus]YP_010772863.1 hypothetical protein QIT54_gp33 [Nitrosopumilus spindle-shaped virus]QDI73923.1 hypothetical protein [Nitrosopumilus spindle-shaped virus]QDI73971.1 hypothetical protein [Nitrosopumilus spindle-shaped virus]
MKQLAYMPKSKKQEHLTPDLIFDLIKEYWNISKEEFYDPCPPGTPFRAPIFFNGLYGDWCDFNYVNSPFEKDILEAFVTKAHEQKLKGKTTVMLCPTKTDQDWFHDIILKFNYQIKWIRKRLKFKGNKHHATDTHFLVMIK